MPDLAQTVFDDILDLALARDTARRPTLVRVLVDGFVRDPGPRTASEQRQFAELMLHFLDTVDPFTRATVAQKLCDRTDAPAAVVELLASEDPAIAEPILARSPLLAPATIDRLIVTGDEATRHALARRADLSSDQRRRILARSSDPAIRAALDAAVAPPRLAPVAPPTIERAPPPPPAAEAPRKPPEIADEPIERRPPAPPAFLDAPRAFRRALLARLSSAAIDVTIGEVPSDAARGLLRLALLRQREAVAETVSKLMAIPRAMARRVVEDADGEPFLVVARVLNLDEDQFAQITQLINPIAADNTDMVLELRALFRATTRAAAAAVLATWREEARRAAAHAPVQAPPRDVPDQQVTPTAARTTSPPRREGTTGEPR